MDALKALVSKKKSERSKKRKQWSSMKNGKDSKKRYIKRGELVKLEHGEGGQLSSKKKKNIQTSHDASPSPSSKNTDNHSSLSSSSSSSNNKAASLPDPSTLDPSEIKFRLRSIGHPIILFGESLIERFQRLIFLETNVVDAGRTGMKLQGAFATKNVYLDLDSEIASSLQSEVDSHSNKNTTVTRTSENNNGTKTQGSISDGMNNQSPTDVSKGGNALEKGKQKSIGSSSGSSSSVQTSCEAERVSSHPPHNSDDKKGGDTNVLTTKGNNMSKSNIPIKSGRRIMKDRVDNYASGPQFMSDMFVNSEVLQKDYLDLMQLEDEQLRARFVSKFFRKLLQEQANALREEYRDEITAAQKSMKVKFAMKQYKQCADYIAPFFRQCKEGNIDLSILRGVRNICYWLQHRNYIQAGDEYIQLSIGNAPWPIGVTQSGIHARAGQRRIHSNQIAHVMNDECTRKYLTVGIKRLMTFCQKRFPPLDKDGKVNSSRLLG
eukprot:g1372.t1